MNTNKSIEIPSNEQSYEKANNAQNLPPPPLSVSEIELHTITNEQSIEKQKRTYFTVTQPQIDLLKSYFYAHRDQWTPTDYSSRTGIRIGNCRNLLMKLKKNKPIDKIEYQRGRKKLLNKEHAIQLYDMIQNNSKTNLRELYAKLSPIKSKNETIYKPSLSTVYRFIHSGGFEKYGIPRITFKKINPITTISNNEYIKHTRIKYISDFASYSVQYIPIWVDECEWQVNDVRSEGWKTSSKPGVEFSKCMSIQFHLCISLTSSGCFPEIILGQSSETIFDRYMRGFVSELRNNNCLYLIDSERTSLIEELKTIIKEHDQILTIPPGSCVLSPIEKIYDIFKTEYLPKINGKTVEEILKSINDMFITIGKNHSKEAMDYVFQEIYPKVQKREDLSLPTSTII